MRLFGLAVAATILLGGCWPQGPLAPTPTLTGQAILPTKDLKIARVYRSETPSSGRDDVVYLKQICDNDYTDTPALAALAKRYDTPTFTDLGINLTQDHNLNASGGVSGLNLSFVQLGATASLADKVSYAYKGVRRTDVSDQDLGVITSKLGADCRRLIGDWQKKGHLAFVVAGAWNAATTTSTVSFKPDVKADAKLQVSKTFAPGFSAEVSDEQTTTLTGENAYFRVIPLQ